MGFPYGADEDAAFIITWLELNHFEGVKKLADSISYLDKKYDGKIKIEKINKKIDFKNKSILMKGPGLIDYIQSELDNNKKFSIEIKNCSEGILFLPLLYRASINIKYSQLIFYNTNNSLNIYNIINNEISFEQKKYHKTILKNQVKIKIDNKKNYSQNYLNERIITEKTIQDSLSKSLRPQKKFWKKISKIANRTFVPASEESRNKGAGGGNDND